MRRQIYQVVQRLFATVTNSAPNLLFWLKGISTEIFTVPMWLESFLSYQNPSTERHLAIGSCHCFFCLLPMYKDMLLQYISYTMSRKVPPFSSTDNLRFVLDLTNCCWNGWTPNLKDIVDQFKYANPPSHVASLQQNFASVTMSLALTALELLGWRYKLHWPESANGKPPLRHGGSGGGKDGEWAVLGGYATYPGRRWGQNAVIRATWFPQFCTC